MTHIVRFFVLLLLTCPVTSLAVSFNANSFALSNGMQVVVINNSKVPAVSHMVWYKVGGIDEPEGKSGLAHMVEHMMFKGTKAFPNTEFSRIVARNGGNDNAFTSYDFTAYYQNIAKEKLPLVMEMEADRMRNLVFDNTEFKKERNVVIEERNSRVENKPVAQLHEEMSTALFRQHPYRIPLIGWRHEIAKLSLADVKDFYNRYYYPNNAILVISGDVTTSEIKPLAEQYYGAIPSQEVPERVSFSEPPSLTKKEVVLEDKRAGTNTFIRKYIAPNHFFGATEDVYPLVLLAYILGGTDTSILYQELVVEKKIAAGTSSGYDDIALGPSVFSIHVVPIENVGFEKVEEVLHDIIGRVIKHGVDKDDLVRAKNTLTAQDIYAREDLKTLAYIYGEAIASGLDVDYVNQWSNAINAVTNEHIMVAAKRLFSQTSFVTGKLYAIKD